MTFRPGLGWGGWSTWDGSQAGASAPDPQLSSTRTWGANGTLSLSQRTPAWVGRRTLEGGQNPRAPSVPLTRTLQPGGLWGGGSHRLARSRPP